MFLITCNIIHRLVCLLVRHLLQLSKNIKLSSKRERDTVAWIKEKLSKEDGAKLIVAVEDDKVLGYAFGWIDKHDKRFYKYDIGYFSDCFVDEKYRGEDVGEKLAKAMVKWFKSKGLKEVRLAVYFDNPAKDFWDKLGFKEFYENRKLVI